MSEPAPPSPPSPPTARNPAPAPSQRRAATTNDSDKFIVRLPDGMREQIAAAALAEHRTMNAEIVARLQQSFLLRGDVLQVRLEPKMRYLVDLAARKQRRSLDNFLVWAVERALGSVVLKEGRDWTTSVLDDAEALWDVDEPDRLVKLALRYPELLTHEEQIIWKMIRECPHFWKGHFRGDEWIWKVQLESFVFERLRQHWESFVAVAKGAPPTTIAPWLRSKPKPPPPSGAEKPASGFDDMDDDIPF